VELQSRRLDYCNPQQQSSSVKPPVLKDSFFDQKPLRLDAPLRRADPAGLSECSRQRVCRPSMNGEIQERALWLCVQVRAGRCAGRDVHAVRGSRPPQDGLLRHVGHPVRPAARQARSLGPRPTREPAAAGSNLVM
jgi:hypothetical protein